MSKEELDETSKEETIEMLDKDETQVDSRNQQVDSSGNQQVDSGGNQQVDPKNQDQTINQEKLNSQENAISPQASKDDPLPGLPTLAQSPEPQLNITTALTNREPRFKYVLEKEARPRQEI